MEQPASPAAFSALVLAVSIAAGLNIFCAASVNSSIDNSASTVTVTSGRTQSDGQIVTTGTHTFPSIPSVTTIPTTLPITTDKRLTEQNTTIASTVTVPELESPTTVPRLITLDTTTTVADTSALPKTGQQTTEDALTSVTSVGTSTENTTSHLETLERTSSVITQSPNVTALNSTSVTRVPSTETSAASSVTSEHLHITETTSGGTPVISTLLGSDKWVTSSQVTQASKATSETSPTEGSTFSVGVTMQEIKHALSSGSIAAITIAVIALVLLVFSMAAFLKIRHSSYGRLLDDHEYGSWGNYNNPLYDDS